MRILRTRKIRINQYNKLLIECEVLKAQGFIEFVYKLKVIAMGKESPFETPIEVNTETCYDPYQTKANK